MRMIAAGSIGVLLVFAAPWLARGGAAAAPQESAPAKKIESLAWLAGHWRVEGPTGSTEELWLPPRGGLMLGLGRTVSKSGKTEFEFLRIEEDAKGLTYLASPSGAKATPFRATDARAGRALFENPEHDFPKRIEYQLSGGKLTASIAGDKPGPSWTFERVGDVK